MRHYILNFRQSPLKKYITLTSCLCSSQATGWLNESLTFYRNVECYSSPFLAQSIIIHQTLQSSMKKSIIAVKRWKWNTDAQIYKCNFRLSTSTNLLFKLKQSLAAFPFIAGINERTRSFFVQPAVLSIYSQSCTYAFIVRNYAQKYRTAVCTLPDWKFWWSGVPQGNGSGPILFARHCLDTIRWILPVFSKFFQDPNTKYQTLWCSVAF